MEVNTPASSLFVAAGGGGEVGLSNIQWLKLCSVLCSGSALCWGGRFLGELNLIPIPALEKLLF